MVNFLDLITPQSALNRKALKKTLSAKEVNLGDLHRSGIDPDALESIVTAKRSRHFEEKNIQDRAIVLKEAKLAQEALSRGDIEPAVKLVHDGRFNLFEVVTENKKDKHALDAKAKVAETLFKDDAQEGSGRFYFFARSNARKAIDGYSALGLIRECATTMEKACERFKEHREDYVAYGLKEFRTGYPEKRGLGIAALILAEHQDKKLEQQDYEAILKYHPDEKAKIAAIHKLASGKDVQDYDDDRSFDVLLEHLKTEKGETSPSRSAAAQGLTKNFSRTISSTSAENERGTAFDIVVVDEMKKGSDHILKHILDTPQKTVHFLVMRDERLRERGLERAASLVDLLPSDEQGQGIAKARNHFASQILEEVTYSYTLQNKDNVFDSNFKERAGHARDVATLSRDVLMDDTLKKDGQEKLEAERMLRQLIVVEDHKAVQDQTNLLGVMQSNMDHTMKELSQKHLAQREGYIGFGRATLDILENASGTSETRAISSRIKLLTIEKTAKSQIMAPS